MIAITRDLKFRRLSMNYQPSRRYTLRPTGLRIFFAGSLLRSRWVSYMLCATLSCLTTRVATPQLREEFRTLQVEVGFTHRRTHVSNMLSKINSIALLRHGGQVPSARRHTQLCSRVRTQHLVRVRLKDHS